jgi:hypothetical protein
LEKTKQNKNSNKKKRNPFPEKPQFTFGNLKARNGKGLAQFLYLELDQALA